MTIYTPEYKVTIAGVEQTSSILTEGIITFGRNDFFEPTQPSYCNIELLDLDGTGPDISLLDTVIIEVKDSSGSWVKLFTGEVSNVYNSIAAAGPNAQPNVIQIQAVGPLATLVKRSAGAVAYPQELDGERIERILQETLFTAWEDLSSTFTWNDLGTETWATYGVQGLTTIDAGRYEVLARDAELAVASDLTDLTSNSGLGYLYETTAGEIGYADAERRTDNYATNIISIDADLLNAELQTRLQTADISNSVVVRYGDPVAEHVAQNDASIDSYGLLELIRDTILAESADAQEQATNFVNYRGTPRASMEAISLNLANGNMSDSVRDDLLAVSMDSLIALTNLPVGLFPSGTFEGFTEGWTWTLGRKNLELTMSVSNSVYSTLDTQWEDYNPTTQWQNLANDYTWLDVA